jgi:hypothetical protein
MRYLGQRLPGNQSQRAKLLSTLKEILEEEGVHWVDLNRDVLLKEAEVLVDFWESPSEHGKKRKRTGKPKMKERR